MTKYPLNISVKATNYKCFGDTPQGFDDIKPINLIIGRNNSGKSALIDLIKYLTLPYDLSTQGHKKRTPEVFLTATLTIDDIKNTFSASTSIGNIGNLFNYGSKYVDSKITVKVIYKDNRTENNFVSIDDTDKLESLAQYDHQFNFKSNLARNLNNPLSGKIFKKIGAERDVRPEGEDENNNLQLTDAGVGATNIVRSWLTRDDRDASLIEKKLLNALNEIFEPDGTFTRIQVKKKSNGAWEIVLEEANKGLVSLSDSGSGLKTIILVLLNTIVLPQQENKSLDKYIFAFEELENNLHPALLRRLLIYITNLQSESGCCIVLTTHSSITIDFYGKNEGAQIIHVRNNGDCATASRTLGYKDNIAILDDLDVRASDLLQSNGVIWVEGPSDRTYIRKWVELWSDGKFEEGIHYQCLIYGGRLLSHLSADNPDEVDRGIAILRANRNLILVMDSDKDTAEKELNDTKKRIVSEIEAIRGLAWVTKGREIENYLPVNALKGLYGNEALLGAKQFTKLPDYLKNSALDTKKEFDKVGFAEKVLPFLKKEELINVLDLNEKMTALCGRIGEWNGIIIK